MDAGVSHFIPLPKHEIKQRLFADPLIEPFVDQGLVDVCTMLEALNHHSSLAELERLKVLYSDLDPDSDHSLDMTKQDDFITAFSKVLEDGNWEEISEPEFEAALDGQSVFPISMEVRMEEFGTMKLYKLGVEEGDITVRSTIDKILRRPGRLVRFSMYDRVIQFIRFQDSDWFEESGNKKHDPGEMGRGLHLRLFKNVPVNDLEIIFPNTSPRMRMADKAKISFPLIIGLIMLFQQYVLPILTGGSTVTLSTALLIALASAFGSYAMKAYMTYRKTKEKYMASVAKDLYFKGQANNLAVLNLVMDLADEQEVKESLLVYSIMLAEAAAEHTLQSLDERIEDWLGQQGVRTDFEIRDALGDLAELGLIELDAGVQDEGGEWIVDRPLGTATFPILESLARLDDVWDGLYRFER